MILKELTAFRTEATARLAELQQHAVAIRTGVDADLISASNRLSNLEEQVARISRIAKDRGTASRGISRLSTVILVIYGGVISYALYAFADSLILHGILPAIHSWWAPAVLIDTIVRFLLFAPVFLFLLKDLGDVAMIEARFPAKREFRYLFEFIAASFYLITFALLAQGSFLSLLTFSVVLFAGGRWCTELAREYRRERCRIGELAKTLRTLHYIGGGIFLVLVGALWAARIWLRYDQDPLVRLTLAATAAAIFLICYIEYERRPRRLHGRFVRRYLLSYLQTSAFLRKKSWFGSGKVR